MRNPSLPCVIWLLVDSEQQLPIPVLGTNGTMGDLQRVIEWTWEIQMIQLTVWFGAVLQLTWEPILRCSAPFVASVPGLCATLQTSC